MQPLILLCGLLCDETLWADIPRRLAQVATVRIVSFDAENSIGAMADAVLARASPRFALAGHSMGGRVALEIWRRAPERVLGLGLLNTAVNPTEPCEYATRGALIRLARTRGMSALAASWLPSMMGESTERLAELLPILTAMVERSTPESFAGQVNALLLRPDARTVLPSIRVPTLLIRGTNEPWSSLTQYAEIHRIVPHARLVEIAGSGHLAPIERPDAVARALHGWLSGISPPPGSTTDRPPPRS